MAIVPKPLRYTGHAEDSITERELDRSWVEETVRRPDWSAPDPRQAGVERRFRVIPAFGGRILRVARLETLAENSYIDGVLRPGCEKTEMTPTLKYRPADNAAYIRFSSAKVLESAEVAPAIVFDYDKDGRIVGIELLDAQAQLPADALNAAA